MPDDFKLTLDVIEYSRYDLSDIDFRISLLRDRLKADDIYQYEKDNVLIPFAGSGSEMLGCKELKRNCIAFEIESKYIDIIKQRTNDTGTLF